MIYNFIIIYLAKQLANNIANISNYKKLNEAFHTKYIIIHTFFSKILLTYYKNYAKKQIIY